MAKYHVVAKSQQTPAGPCEASRAHNFSRPTTATDLPSTATNTQQIRRNGSQGNQGYATILQSQQIDQQLSRPIPTTRSLLPRRCSIVTLLSIRYNYFKDLY